MPKQISDALAALEGLEGGEELVQAVQAELSKKNNEAKNLRDRSKGAETKQAETLAKLQKVAASLGLDLEAEDFDGVLEGQKKVVEDLKKELTVAKTQGDQSKQEEIRKALTEAQEAKDQTTKLQKELDKRSKEVADLGTKYSTEKEKRLAILKTQGLTQALIDSKAVKPSVISKMLLQNVKVDEATDELLFVDEKGAEVSLAEGVKAFLGANPEFVANVQNPGAGSPPGAGAAGTAAAPIKVSRAQMADVAFYRAHQKDFLNGKMVCEE
jgi:hypothetical protein